MGFNGDWKVINYTQDVETKTVLNPDTGVEKNYYRVITTEELMETFTNVGTFSTLMTPPTPPKVGIRSRIGNSYRTTIKETDSGEHTEVLQTIGSWQPFTP